MMIICIETRSVAVGDAKGFSLDDFEDRIRYCEDDFEDIDRVACGQRMRDREAFSALYESLLDALATISQPQPEASIVPTTI